MTKPVDAVQVLTDGLWFDERFVPTAAIMICEALDPETGERNLIFRRDSDAGVWQHMGMLEVVLEDLKDECRASVRPE